jgi:hypothetical protein
MLTVTDIVTKKGFLIHLAAAWACERSLRACIELTLHRTPTAGLVAAQTEARRNMEKEV